MAGAKECYGLCHGLSHCCSGWPPKPLAFLHGLAGNIRDLLITYPRPTTLDGIIISVCTTASTSSDLHSILQAAGVSRPHLHRLCLTGKRVGSPVGWSYRWAWTLNLLNHSDYFSVSLSFQGALRRWPHWWTPAPTATNICWDMRPSSLDWFLCLYIKFLVLCHHLTISNLPQITSSA